jgi:hypothetical protein
MTLFPANPKNLKVLGAEEGRRRAETPSRSLRISPCLPTAARIDMIGRAAAISLPRYRHDGTGKRDVERTR